jgi:hypothetical protein
LTPPPRRALDRLLSPAILHTPRRFLVNPFHPQAARATAVVCAGGNGSCTERRRGWIEHRPKAGPRYRRRSNRSGHGDNYGCQNRDLADAIAASTPDLTGPACWHVGRLWTARGAAIERVRTARSHIDHPVRDRAGLFRDLPCARRVAAGRRGVSAICRARVPRLPALWMAGRWLRPLCAPHADRIVSWPSRARVAASAPGAVDAGWPSGRRISSITYFRTYRFDNGC